MDVTIIGSGDAFGSGGRLNTCFCSTSQSSTFLIDCGATSMVGLRRQPVDIERIDTILITHFHADHFAGLAPFILASSFMKRSAPLLIAGPRGIKEKLSVMMELSFPGSGRMRLPFDISICEFQGTEEAQLGKLVVQAFEMSHGPDAGMCLGYRIQVDGRVISYSADTEWTEAVVPLGILADLFMCEAYTYEKKVRWHLDFKALETRLPEIRPKRLLLTHMSEDMLSRSACPHIAPHMAHDGLVITL